MGTAAKQNTGNQRGKLRIGDDWNAITIIALSQSSPLKAVAEFVENSIDAGAKNIEIIRGREKGDYYLRIRDDGKGIPRDNAGIPDFKYVATHICDSVKRQLKTRGNGGVQGEFGIGLLSFWTVGETLLMRSPSSDGKTYEMRMAKGDPSYEVTRRRTLFAESGTELTITPLLSGLRQFSGEKIQWYLASELRDRIRQSNVQITVLDRHARKQFTVEPRQFEGRLLHDLPAIESVYLELYLSVPKPNNAVGLYRSGTRVLSSMTELTAFSRAPWNSPYLQGIVDAPEINLTPGTRLGVIHDERLAALIESLKPVEEVLIAEIEAQQRAEDERASQEILRTIARAFREALIVLPSEEYDWFELKNNKSAVTKPGPSASANGEEDASERSDNDGEAVAQGVGVAGESDDAWATVPAQKRFFEYAGPLASVRISPASCVVRVNQSRALRALARDQQRRQIDREVLYQWRVVEGRATLDNADSEIATLTASTEPGLVKVAVTATEGRDLFEAQGKRYLLHRFAVFDLIV